MRSRLALLLAVLLAACLAWLVWRVDATTTTTERVTPEVVAERLEPSPDPELAHTTVPIETRTDAARQALPDTLDVHKLPDFSRVTRIVGDAFSRAESKAVTQGLVTARRVTQDGVVTKPETCWLDGRGHYVLIGLAPGAWTVTCAAGGYLSQERHIALDDGREAVIDFDLVPSARVHTFSVYVHTPGGRALDEGALLRVLCVESCPQRGLPLPSSARLLVCRAVCVHPAQKVPAVQPPAAPGEWFRVRIENSGSACCVLLLGDRVLDVATFNEGMSRLDLVVSADDLANAMGSVTVIAIDDASGAPIAGASVRVRSASGQWSEGTTDSNGKATIARVTAGVGLVEIASKLHAKAEKQVDVGGATDNDLGSVRLRAAPPGNRPR